MRTTNSRGMLCLALTLLTACTKSTPEKINSNNDNIAVSSLTVPADPAVAPTIGFFMNRWGAKRFAIPAFTDKVAPATAALTVTVDASTIVTKIAPSLFGNNIHQIMTQVVTEPVLMTNITNLHPGIIRLGGNNSSTFFWNALVDKPPVDAPATHIDKDGGVMAPYYYFGRNTYAWTMSTDNYYNVLQQTGNEGIITVNYGYARYGTSLNPVATAAHLAADWVRYDKGRTRYWEVGNESNGTWQHGYRILLSANKDGQPEIITGDLYGRHFKVFADSMRKAAKENGVSIYIGAQLIEHPVTSSSPIADRTWNTDVLKQAGSAADYFIVHHYYSPWNINSTASAVLSSAIDDTKLMSNYLPGAFAAAGVGTKPIALTEWNINAVQSKQQVSQVAGMHAVMVLGELMKNKFGMASRWDLANSWTNGDDHGLFSKGESESEETLWQPRPAFFYLYYFKKFLGDRLINASVADTNVNVYASTFNSGELSVTLVNKTKVARNVKLAFNNFVAGDSYYWYELTGEATANSFSRKVFVNGVGPTGVAGGPSDYTNVKAYRASTAAGVMVTLPPLSVVNMVVAKK